MARGTQKREGEELWAESKHQQKLFIWFNNSPEFKEYRGLFWHNYNNPPNAVAGNLLVASGLMKGLPDMTLAYPTKEYPGLYLELKRIGQKPRPDQIAKMKQLRDVGYCVASSDNLESSKQIILEYLGI